MVQLQDAYAYERQSQHKFRTNRHIEAATRKDSQIFQLQMDKLSLSSRISELNHQKQVLSSEFTEWRTWWEHGAHHETVLHELLSRHDPPECCSIDQGGDFKASSMEVAKRDGRHDDCVHPLPVHETRAAQDVALGPVAAQEDDWRQHIVWTLPSSGKQKLDQSRAGPTAKDLEAPDARGSSCELVGGPSAMDTELIYTDEEMSQICDALVSPLAREMHMSDNMEELPVKVFSDGAKHGLGKLLRDICCKVVPLTRVLEMRRDTVQKHMVRRGGEREDPKYKETSANLGDGKFFSPQGLG